VQMVEAYFDESGAHNESPVLCVAGYIFEKDSCIKMNEEWSLVLEKFNLPFFRMSAIAPGSKPFFNELTKDQRIQVVKDMISIIKKRASSGIAITVEPKMYDEIVLKSPEIGSAYTCLLHMCVTAVRSWADENKYNGKIAYFFEGGHRSAHEANHYMTRIFKIPRLRAAHRYSSHSFVDKKEVKPLQAADLLAWQWLKDRKRNMEGNLSHRLDLQALVMDRIPPHHVMHFDKKKLQILSSIIYRNKYPLTYPGIFGLSPEDFAFFFKDILQ